VMHSHLALYAAFGISIMGCMFWLVPRVTGKKLFSKKMMDVTWWVTFMGFITFMAGMMLAGLVANSQWYQHLTIAQALDSIRPYYILRAIGGGIVVVSAFLFAINISATFLSKHVVHPGTVENYGGAKQK